MRFASLHTRNNAPRLPSLPLLSNSGATRRSQEIVRMAEASLREVVRREEMSCVVMACMASSACVDTELMRGDEG